MKLRLSLYCIFFFLFFLSSSAQKKDFELKNFTQENGLPSNESYFVYPDSKNYLWIATDQGVVRYNGNKMDRFDLPDNVVFKIREDSKGRIWFFSHTGKLAYFFNNVIHPYKYNDSITANLKNILIVDAYVNDNDDIIICSTYEHYKISGSGIISKFENGYGKNMDSIVFFINRVDHDHYFTQQVKFDLDKTDTTFISLATLHSIVKYAVPCKMEQTNQYGCVTFDEKSFFFFAHNKVIKLNTDGSFKVKELPARILCLHAGSDGKLWAGLLKQGTVLLDTELTEERGIQLLKDKSVTSITNDYEGGTWLTTLEKGLYYLKSKYIYKLGDDINLSQPFSRLYNVHDSILLFTTEQGLYKYSGNTVSTVYAFKNEKINDMFLDNGIVCLAGRLNLNYVYSFAKIETLNTPLFKKIMIVQSSSEMLRISSHEYFFNQGISMAKMDIDKYISNTSNTGFIKTISRSLIFKPSTIFLDSKKEVWVGSINRLYKLYSAIDSLVPFMDSSALFKKGITTIRELDNGMHCFGIRFGGIALLRNNNIVANITKADGLLSNSIKYLLPMQDELWAATANGISVIKFESYNPINYTITNIGKNEGFNNVIINQLIPFQGNIMAATSNGIYVIEKPGHFIERAPQPLPLYINSVTYYKGDTSGIGNITVPYKNNRLIIKYSAICFNSPDEVKYYYKLGINDTAWQTINGNELLLENLSPGIYELELKASILNQHRFSGIERLKITIEKPWWQNNWLRLAMVIVFILAVYLFYKSRVNRIKKREKQKTIQHNKMIELEQTALRSQMNPHFIFNCLSSIQQLIVSGKVTEANEHLVKFARLIRKTLELSARPYIKIADEIEYLGEYLFLEQLRIPGEFDYHFKIDDTIDVNKTEIPNMMLQPIVENCIRHGIKHLENRKGNITIYMKPEPHFIYCRITDNGVGRNASENYNKGSFSEQKSFGLDIVKKRLELLNEPGRHVFSIETKNLHDADGIAAGTEVIIQLPFKIIKL